MTKQEFQKRIGAEISQKDYSIVEHVYTWHPSISEVEGKEQIAELGFAFSDKQFDEMMGKWGLDPEKDLDKIYRIPGGGFIQKKDHKHFHEVTGPAQR